MPEDPKRALECPKQFLWPVKCARPSVCSQLAKSTILTYHALKRFAPYAQTASPGWGAPGKEAGIKPHASNVGAGVVSAGSIDNTYLPKPLTNAWGKAREQSTNEIRKPPHKQATDLLLAAKGAKLPAPYEGISDMQSVRPTYSRTIPLFHPIDPQRVESGFVRSPNIIPGAQPPPISPLMAFTPEDMPTVPADHALRKLAYDQKCGIGGRIPVSRIVRATHPRPSSAMPMFTTKPAGLPGGLSLIPAK